MSNEHPVADIQLMTELYDIVGIAIKRRMSAGLIGGKIRFAGANMIEQDDPEILLESGSYEPPHILVATKSVREYHGALPGARYVRVMALRKYHRAFILPSVRWGQRCPKPSGGA